MTGLTALPSESIAQPSLAATLVNLYGGLAVSAWILLLPAVLSALVTLQRRAPRWVRAVSAASGLASALCLAVPPMAWAPVGSWLIAVSLGCLVGGRAQASRGGDAPG
jgi:hypothetical protein